MKLAISIWNGRIAPVFDVSQRCLIVMSDKTEANPLSCNFPGESAEAKARFLAESGVGILVCGAISKEYEYALQEYKVKTFSFLAGSVEEVIVAWKADRLKSKTLAMPGCGCLRRHRCRKRGGRENK